MIPYFARLSDAFSSEAISVAYQEFEICAIWVISMSVVARGVRRGFRTHQVSRRMNSAGRLAERLSNTTM